jgi:WhiB family transcriptional regulator, redox-sensing transcriptional regulator
LTLANDTRVISRICTKQLEQHHAAPDGERRSKASKPRRTTSTPAPEARMWNLLDDEGAFPSDARRPAPATPSNVLPMFAAVEDDGPMGWQERALCAQTDPEAFFPEKGGSTREAKRICMGCEVRDACLEYALAHDERFGIWGGLSERERRRLKRGII